MAGCLSSAARRRKWPSLRSDRDVPIMHPLGRCRFERRPPAALRDCLPHERFQAIPMLLHFELTWNRKCDRVTSTPRQLTLQREILSSRMHVGCKSHFGAQCGCAVQTIRPDRAAVQPMGEEPGTWNS